MFDEKLVQYEKGGSEQVRMVLWTNDGVCCMVFLVFIPHVQNLQTIAQCGVMGCNTVNTCVSKFTTHSLALYHISK